MNIKDLLIDLNGFVELNNLDIFKIANAVITNNLKFNFLENEIVECIEQNIPKIQIDRNSFEAVNTISLKIKNKTDRVFFVTTPFKKDFYINKIEQKNNLIYSKSINLETFNNNKTEDLRNIILNLSITQTNIKDNSNIEFFNQVNTLNIKTKKINQSNSSKKNTLYEEIAFMIENKTDINDNLLEIVELKYDIIDPYIKNIIINDFDNKKNILKILDLANNINKNSSIKKNEKQKRVI